eukprot:TRINITY_DN2969_c0_g1_i2.p2 TRINITY_DN2969_c0_g1~~TRINITY_DN2969_c0_g1_i2.p2  ORF type:complete len:108 (+),score=39.63 TRINITY_DN2969_c0_g1_i2:435-758(+)
MMPRSKLYYFGQGCKAFAISTAVTVGAAVAITTGISYALDVRSVPEFGRVMRGKLDSIQWLRNMREQQLEAARKRAAQLIAEQQLKQQQQQQQQQQSEAISDEDAKG